MRGATTRFGYLLLVVALNAVLRCSGLKSGSRWVRRYASPSIRRRAASARPLLTTCPSFGPIRSGSVRRTASLRSRCRLAPLRTSLGSVLVGYLHPKHGRGPISALWAGSIGGNFVPMVGRGKLACFPIVLLPAATLWPRPSCGVWLGATLRGRMRPC